MSHRASVTTVSKNLLCQQMSGHITQQDRQTVCHTHFQKEKASPPLPRTCSHLQADLNQSALIQIKTA